MSLHCMIYVSAERERLREREIERDIERKRERHREKLFNRKRKTNIDADVPSLCSLHGSITESVGTTLFHILEPCMSIRLIRTRELHQSDLHLCMHVHAALSWAHCIKKGWNLKPRRERQSRSKYVCMIMYI